MSKLGETLRARRVELGLSLEQVEDAIKVRAKILGYIERGEYDRLPNPGYVRGYISSYARFLELDSPSLLSMYRAETGATTRRSLNKLPQSGVAVAPMGQQHAVPWRAAVAIALAVVLLSLAIWGIARLASRKPDSETRKGPKIVETTGTVSATSTVESTGSAETTGMPSDPAGTDGASSAIVTTDSPPFTLGIKVSQGGASWFKVTIDGQVAYEGVLTAGQKRDFEVTGEAVVRVGKPEAATVTRDGKPVAVERVNNLGEVTIRADEPGPGE